jgi:hypothetical protein
MYGGSGIISTEITALALHGHDVTFVNRSK